MHRFFVGALIVTGALGCRDRAAEPQPAPDNRVTTVAPVAPVTPDAAVAKVSAPAPPPTLPETPQVTPDEAFTAEVRDDRWAPATERKIAERFQKVRGAKLVEKDCKNTQCRLVLAGSEADISRAVADLESGVRGLQGFAKSVLLTKPDTQPDGSLRLRVFAQFER